MGSIKPQIPIRVHVKGINEDDGLPVGVLADYEQIIQKFDLLGKIESAQIDEVWMFGGPYFGFYESRMVGNVRPATHSLACQYL